MRRMISVISVAALVTASGAVMAADEAGTVPANDSVATITAYLAGSSNSPYRQALKDCLSGPQKAWREQFSLTAKSDDPELLAMVICSGLLETPEKQYWLDTLPEMSAKQKEQLWDNLTAEFVSNSDPVRQELDSLNRELQEPGEHKP